MPRVRDLRFLESILIWHYVDLEGETDLLTYRARNLLANDEINF